MTRATFSDRSLLPSTIAGCEFVLRWAWTTRHAFPQLTPSLRRDVRECAAQIRALRMEARA